MTGMHRSGTSLLSRVVNLLGFDLGPDDALMPATSDNPKGFWENVDVVDLNNDLFRELGGWWNRPPALVDGWERDRSLDPLRSKAVGLLGKTFDSASFAAVKDPRLAILLPFWRTVAPVVSTLISVRDPREVATSMVGRDGMDAERVADLWLRYNIDALAHSTDALVVAFTDWFDDPDAAITRIVDHLGVDFPNAETRAALDQFIEPNLRRSVPHDVEVGPRMEKALLVHGLLEREPRGGALRLVSEEMRSSWRTRAELTDARKRLKGVAEEATRLELEGKARHQEIARLQERLAAAEERNAELATMAAEGDARERDRQDALAQYAAATKELVSQKAAMKRLAARAEAERQRQSKIIQESQKAAAASAKDIRLLSRWLDELRADYRRLLASRRWRMGNALGRVSEVIRGRAGSEMATARMSKTFARYGRWRNEKASSPSQQEPKKKTKTSSPSAKKVKAKAPASSSRSRPKGHEQTSRTGGISRELDEQVRADAYAAFIASVESPPPAAQHPAHVRAVVVVPWTRVAAADLEQAVQTTLASCDEAGVDTITIEAPDGAALAAALDDVARSHPEAYLVLLAPGDCLIPGFRDGLGAHPGAAIVVFDDDVVSEAGRRSRPRFKPGIQPELLLEYDYVGRGAAVQGSAVSGLGGFGDLGMQVVRDVVLRALDAGLTVAKSDYVLLHRSPDEIETDEGLFQEVVVRTLRRRGTSEHAVLRPAPDGTHVHFALAPDLKVSVIIPFRDRVDLLRECLSSIKRLTLHPRYEILLVDNNSSEESTLSYLQELADDPVVQVLKFPEPFNYSRINNFAASRATGDVLLFLNNDTKVLTAEWMSYLAGQAWQEGIGTVGAQLYFANGRIQHSGVVIGVQGFAAHVFAGEHAPFLPPGVARHARNCSAVTGACCAVRADRFNAVGGFDEEFIVTGSDVELGLRFYKRGLRNVVLPTVSLFHYEKQSRQHMPVNPVDIRLSLDHYQPYLRTGDPYWNQNLSTTSTAMVPRTKPEPGYLELLEKMRGALGQAPAIADRHRSAMLLSQYDADTGHLEANKRLMDGFAAGRTVELNAATWFVPPFDHVYRGGIYTIMRIADSFTRLSGTMNHIVVYGRAQVDLEALRLQIRQAFPELSFELHLLRPGEDVHRLPPADIGICTLWSSAYHLLRYNQCRGKFYLVQDYEPVFEPGNAISGLIEQTYRFGFLGIANTPGVADAYRAYGNEAMAFIPAVDTDLFHPGNAGGSDGPLKIAFYGRPGNPRNGFQLGIQALARIKDRYGDAVQIVSAGAAFDVVEEGAAGVLENLGVLPGIESVAELYRSSDIGLVFMYSRHPSYQPLEYMASGCATVTNFNEANLWLLRHGENALLAMPTVSGVVDALTDLIEQPELRRKIVEGGLDTVRGSSWDQQLASIHRYVTTGES